MATLSLGVVNPGTLNLGTVNPGTITGVTHAQQGTLNLGRVNPGTLTLQGENTPKSTASSTSSTATSGGGGSSSGTNYQDKSNDIAMQEAGLGSAGATENAGTSAVDKALASIMGEYNTDAANAGKEYGSESTSNETDLQGNKETALQNAVQGRQGLYGTLASLGALSGTGLDLANHAVQQGANEDLTTAADTYAKNQNALDSGYNAFKNQDATRRQQAKSAAANDKEQVQNDYYKSMQSYLTNLANDYQDEGNTATSKSFQSRAARLFPSIAKTNVPTIDLGYSGSAYTAPTLDSYVGAANNTTVKSTPASGTGVFSVPGLVATNQKKSATAGVPV